MRREDRGVRAPRSSSQRRQNSVPRSGVVTDVGSSVPGVRPPSRPSADIGSQQPSPQGSDASEQPPRSAGSGSGRPPPDPARVYGINQHSEAGYGGVRRSSRQQTPGGAVARESSAGAGSRPARSSSTGAAARAAAAGAARVISSGGDGQKGVVFSYLKVYGLNQYARAFMEAGLTELEAIGRLSETEALEFLERLRVYPGHRLRLLRAIDHLRHALQGAERRDAAQLLEDDAALERLCAQNEELNKEKGLVEGEAKRLHDDNNRLIGVIRQQDTQLKKTKERISELEELVQSQTEQVNFLAQQLQVLAEADPKKESELYRSYKDSFVDDWGEAEKIELPEVTTFPGAEESPTTARSGGDLGEQRSFTPQDFTPKVGLPVAPATVGAPSQVGLDLGRSSRNQPNAMQRVSREAPARSGVELGVPPSRSRLAKSLDSAQVKECLAGFDVDHIIRCLAMAIQNKMIVTVGKSRPHTANSDRIAACAIFLEPACRERLEEAAQDPLGNHTVELAGNGLGGTLGKIHDPLNNIAVRSVPHRWDIYGFLRDVMVNFRLEPEVSMVTLVYLDRFCESSGVAMTPDNWQRLSISAMMLASKVWNDESFENIEFAQLCPLYTIDEINTFERIFLKCVGYNMSVKGSQYAKTYFLLRTLGAKDSADFGLEPIDDKRASRLLERCLEKQVEFKERYPADVRELDCMNWTM